jgi:hypothetical protein
MKKWWFSIVMWLFAAFFVVYPIVAIKLFDEELLFYTSIVFSSITPTMFCLAIGFGNMPRKENKDE